MKEKDTVFDYLIQIFLIYGVTILCMCLFCVIFGSEAKELSTLFSLGSAGLGVNTMLQFFLLSAIIATLRFVLFTDGLIKCNIPVVGRIILMFGSVIVIIVFFVIRFDWFPVGMWESWVGFFICFFVSAIVSTVVSYMKEKHENKKMEDALNNLKKRM